ncbi:hypothetical protein CK203_030038 [Vitis vinifera]|uniref:DUF4283 domain-containing protein n=1 Tax=Vitis vinifera TaxID=29760 RepID=A0A438IK61_VITVI|nr:hypothetical protein CK203_030038 [Vitis vinifera]
MRHKVGGRCWFAMELKSFEISVEDVGGKLCGIILERWRDFSLWIRRRVLGEGQGVRKRKEGNLDWTGALTRQEGSSFVLFVMWEEEILFGLSGGKRNPGGRIGDDQGEVEEEKRSFAEVTKAKVGRLRDVVWLQLGGRDLRSRDEQLGLCLVGRWEFEDAVEVERVLRKGIRYFEDKVFHIERRCLGSWGIVAEVGGGSSCFAIQLWCEVPPWVSMVVSMQREGEDKGERWRRGMAGDIEAVAHKNGKGKVVVEERCSSSDVGERKIGEGSGPKGYWAEFNKRGPGPGVCIGAFKEPRALGVKIVTFERSLDDAFLGVVLITEAGGTSIADESLLEEASRAVVDPLRVIWADGSERGASTKLEGGAKAYGGKVLLARDLESGLEGEERRATVLWMSFLTFYRCLGMPIEGFEGEIMELMKRMKERKDLKGNLVGKKRKVQKISRSDRELKKLECSVNYSGTERGANDSAKRKVIKALIKP